MFPGHAPSSSDICDISNSVTSTRIPVVHGIIPVIHGIIPVIHLRIMSNEIEAHPSVSTSYLISQRCLRLQALLQLRLEEILKVLILCSSARRFDVMFDPVAIKEIFVQAEFS
jgi:hypothetical protein